jgi:hypothetical protein
MSGQKGFIHSNTIQTQFLGLSIFDPIREDNINIFGQYIAFMKQEMNKKQACGHLKIRPVQLIVFEKLVTYKLHITLSKKGKS